MLRMNKPFSRSTFQFVPCRPFAMSSEQGAPRGRLMEGKRGLIMGVANDHSIAWGIAKTLWAHGAGLAFTYQVEALSTRVSPLAEQVSSEFRRPCDGEG